MKTLQCVTRQRLTAKVGVGKKAQQKQPGAQPQPKPHKPRPKRRRVIRVATGLSTKINTSLHVPFLE